MTTICLFQLQLFCDSVVFSSCFSKPLGLDSCVVRGLNSLSCKQCPLQLLVWPNTIDPMESYWTYSCGSRAKQWVQRSCVTRVHIRRPVTGSCGFYLDLALVWSGRLNARLRLECKSQSRWTEAQQWEMVASQGHSWPKWQQWCSSTHSYLCLKAGPDAA